MTDTINLRLPYPPSINHYYVRTKVGMAIKPEGKKRYRLNVTKLPRMQEYNSPADMQKAINEADISLEQVEYINTHGTSTPIGDIAEIKAIQDLFGQHAYDLSLTSSKSMTGHLLGGSGAVEAIISILSMQNGMVTPTINHEEGDEDPNIDYKLNFTFNQAQPRDIHYAMSNNFGFGGHNACLLFKKY